MRREHIWLTNISNMLKIIEQTIDLVSEYENIDLKYAGKPDMFSPHIDARNTQLSIDFFTQMDALGKQVYKDWQAK